MNKLVLLLVILAGCVHQVEAPDDVVVIVAEPEKNKESKCRDTVIVYEDNTQENEHDKQLLYGAAIRCSQIYPQSPCLVKATKVGEFAWNIICGKAN